MSEIELVSGCITSISLALLRPYIIYAKLNLLLFLLSLAHPLSYLLIDLSSKGTSVNPACSSQPH